MESSNDTSVPWWQAGNLHDQNLAVWQQAEQNNRLATALDMLITIKEDLGADVHYQSGEELMRYVLETVSCLDTIATQVPEPAEISVPQAMLSAARELGYLSDATEIQTQ